MRLKERCPKVKCPSCKHRFRSGVAGGQPVAPTHRPAKRRRLLPWMLAVECVSAGLGLACLAGLATLQWFVLLPAGRAASVERAVTSTVTVDEVAMAVDFGQPILGRFN